jgi:hypothetical protein
MKIYLRIERPTGIVIVKATLGRVARWRAFLRQSWKKRRYWVQGQGSRRRYRLQILDRFVEWNIGDPATIRAAPPPSPGGRPAVLSRGAGGEEEL